MLFRLFYFINNIDFLKSELLLTTLRDALYGKKKRTLLKINNYGKNTVRILHHSAAW